MSRHEPEGFGLARAVLWPSGMHMHGIEGPGERPSLRVLVLDAESAAAQAVLRALAGLGVEVHAAAASPTAGGLHLVPASHRVLLPPSTDLGFSTALFEHARERLIDVIVPTTRAGAVAVARERAAAERSGIRLLVPPMSALFACLDDLRLVRTLAAFVPVPRTEPLDERLDEASWTFPMVVKLRRHDGRAEARLVSSAAELRALGPGEQILAQELLPGDEYFVDLLAAPGGAVRALAAAQILSVRDGAAEGLTTVQDPELESLAVSVAERLGLEGLVGVRFRRDRFGQLRALGVVPHASPNVSLAAAGGLNLPHLALKLLVGEQLPAVPEVRPTALVRVMSELHLDPSELEPSSWARELGSALRVRRVSGAE